MSTETPHHTVTARFEDGYFVEALATMKCTAPADAMCHAVWDCGCQEWSDPRIEDGRPIHSVIVFDDDEEDREELHTGQFDPEFCNLREWFDNSDETLNGEITFPVTPEWTGDGYLFNAKQGTPVTDDEQPEADATAIFRHRIRQTIAHAREQQNLTEPGPVTEPMEEA